MKIIKCLLLCVFLLGCNIMKPGSSSPPVSTDDPVMSPQPTQSAPAVQSEKSPTLASASSPPEAQALPAEDDKTALRAAVAAFLGKQTGELDVVISENTGNHARGGADNGYFLAAKINGEWQVVAAGQGIFDCTALKQYNFPGPMIPECYPGASSAAQSSSNTTVPAVANQPPPNAEQIHFKKGGTSAYDQQTISVGQKPAYIVSAAKGQTMIVGVSSSSNDVFLDIQGIQNGQVLVSHSEARNDWSGILPDTQTYLITLSTANANTDYFLSVEIPANIQFEKGEDSISIDGYIDVHKELYPNLITRVSYLVYGSAGQTMTIDIISPNINNLSLGIYGQKDGQPYKRYEVKGTSGILKLPQTQGYYINVYSIDGVSTDFTLSIAIE